MQTRAEAPAPTRRQPIRRQALITSTSTASVLDWRDEWTLHIDFMDADHRRLARQIRRIAAHVDRLKPDRPLPARLLDDLAGLAALAKFHFAREEEIMQAAAYPHLDHHRDEHAVLLGECESLVADGRTGRVDWSDLALLPSLEHWLVAHVLDDDRVLARYLRRCGMTAMAPQTALLLPDS